MKEHCSLLVTLWLLSCHASLAADTQSNYYCGGIKHPVNEAPDFAAYNFFYTSRKNRDNAVDAVHLLLSNPNVTTFHLIPAFSLTLHQDELEDLLHSDVAKGLKFVECDVFDVSKDHSMSANGILPLAPSVAILTLFTLLWIFIYSIQ